MSQTYASASESQKAIMIANAIDRADIADMDEDSVKGTSTRELRVYKKIITAIAPEARTLHEYQVEEWIDEAIDVYDSGGSRVADWKR